MLFAYIDESYRQGDAYWLGACLIEASRAPVLRREFARASAAFPSDAGLGADVELHAQHLFAGERSMATLKRRPDARLRVYRAGVRAMMDAGAEVLLVGVMWSPAASSGAVRRHRMQAVRHMFAALEAFVVEREERCLVIADEEEGTTRSVYEELRRHQDRNASVDEPSRLVDAVFVDSRFTPGVQGADLITYLNQRRARFNDERAQKALDGMWKLLDGRVTIEVHPAPSADDHDVETAAAS